MWLGSPDGDVNSVALDLPEAAATGAAWVQFDYGHPQMIQAVTVASLNDAISVFDHDGNAVPAFVEAGDDGVNFKKVADDIPFSSLVQRTVSFGAVTARYFRVVYPALASGVADHDHKITELALESGARMNEWEKRAGYANAHCDFYAIRDPEFAPKFVVQPQDVIELTGKMTPDGLLNWTPPGREVDGPAHWLLAYRS